MKFWQELTNTAWLSLRAGTLFLLGSAAAFFCFFVLVLTVLRFVDPPMSAVMLRDRLAGARVRHEWVPIEKISDHLVRAVISSEDARFCSHNGIDFHEMGRALQTLDRRGLRAVRGASTITMQVAKNLFLWTDRSFLRKGIEIAITPIIELVWPKRRIMEVYLNVAQFGPGQFGIAVAARHQFRHEAIDLTEHEASLLTATLPAPSVRRAGAANAFTRRIAARVRHRMRPGNVQAGCVLD